MLVAVGIEQSFHGVAVRAPMREGGDGVVAAGGPIAFPSRMTGSPWQGSRARALDLSTRLHLRTPHLRGSTR